MSEMLIREKNKNLRASGVLKKKNKKTKPSKVKKLGSTNTSILENLGYEWQ